MDDEVLDYAAQTLYTGYLIAYHLAGGCSADEAAEALGRTPAEFADEMARADDAGRVILAALQDFGARYTVGIVIASLRTRLLNDLARARGDREEGRRG